MELLIQIIVQELNGKKNKDMYTFMISAAFFLLLSGIIFRKRIKENQFFVGLIVFFGTFLTCVTVNGVIGLNTPYTMVEIREVPLIENKISSIKLAPKDSIIRLKSYIDFDYYVNKKDTVCNIDVGWLSITDPKRITIKYVSENDSIPVKRVFQPRKLVDNRWVVPFGVPRGKRIYKLTVPNDSIHNEVFSLTEKYFFKNEGS